MFVGPPESSADTDRKRMEIHKPFNHTHPVAFTVPQGTEGSDRVIILITRLGRVRSFWFRAPGEMQSLSSPKARQVVADKR